MIITKHSATRSKERNISLLSIDVVRLFGSKLDKRDGLQLDEDTYKELTAITYKIHSIRNKNIKGDIYV